MSHENKMDEQRYEQLLESYGANTARWPEQERELALTFAEKNPERAAQIRARGDDLDTMLDNNIHAGSNDLLMARILNAAQNIPQDGLPANDRANYAPLQARWKSLAATLLLTTGIGFSLGQTATADADYQTAETLLLTDYQTSLEAADWAEMQK